MSKNQLLYNTPLEKERVMGAYKRLVTEFLALADSQESTIVAYLSKSEFVIIVPNDEDDDILSASFIQIDYGFLEGYPNLLAKANKF